MLDCDSIISEFERHPRNYIQFSTNAFGKGITSLEAYGIHIFLVLK